MKARLFGTLALLASLSAPTLATAQTMAPSIDEPVTIRFYNYNSPPPASAATARSR